MYLWPDLPHRKHTLMAMHFPNADGMVIGALSRAGETTMYGAGRSLMGDTSRQAHWENVYTTKDENEVSWFQQSPAPSLELIVQAGAVNSSAIIDICGGGAGLGGHLLGGGVWGGTRVGSFGGGVGGAPARPGN